MPFQSKLAKVVCEKMNFCAKISWPWPSCWSFISFRFRNKQFWRKWVLSGYPSGSYWAEVITFVGPAEHFIRRSTTDFFITKHPGLSVLLLLQMTSLETLFRPGTGADSPQNSVFLTQTRWMSTWISDSVRKYPGVVWMSGFCTAPGPPEKRHLRKLKKLSIGKIKLGVSGSSFHTFFQWHNGT